MKPEKVCDIVIIGIGETAELAADYFTLDSPYTVRAFAAEGAFLEKRPDLKELDGCPVLPLDELPERYPAARYKAFVAMAYGRLNHDRARLYQTMKAMGYTLVSYVSSRAFIGSKVRVGDNCFILEHNVLQRNVIVGNDVVLWSGNHIGHRSVIEDHVFLSSHVAVSGYCHIGPYCFLGINSALGDNVTVAENCFVGGGVALMKDTAPGQVYRALPAKAERLSSKIVFGI